VPKRLASLALVVGLAIVAAGCGGGGPSDSSSDWSASDVAKGEAQLESKLTAEGLDPTKTETECVMKGVEGFASPSEALGNSELSSQQGEDLETLGHSCFGGSEDGSDESGAGEEPESLYSGPACEEELSSAGCIQEVEEGESKAIAEGEETYGDEAEEAGSEGTESGEVNPGLREMDEETPAGIRRRRGHSVTLLRAPGVGKGETKAMRRTS
jgi:hypothetical protein